MEFAPKIVVAQVFTEINDSPFEGVEDSSIAFADVDGDNDQDVLITGIGSSGRVSKLYTNNGIGNFTEVIDTPFEGVLIYVWFDEQGRIITSEKHLNFR